VKFVLQGRKRNHKLCERGQSLIESVVAIFGISIVFFGIVQIILALQAEQVHQWAIFLAARSRCVGYGEPGIEKMYLVGNILNSERMISPVSGLPAVAQSDYEVKQIPRFLGPGSVHNSEILDYTSWNEFTPIGSAVSSGPNEHTDTSSQTYSMQIAKLIPVLVPAFDMSDKTLQAEATLETHFPLYLDIN
jgi:hypothetical protein